MVPCSDAVPRRRLLAAVGLAGLASLAGCSALWSQPGATDVVAYNAADEERVVTIVVSVAGAETPHTSKTLRLGPHEAVDPVNDSKLPTNDAYAVDVTVEGGPSETFDWENPTLDRAPLYVVVGDGENVRFLLQAG
jgi:hypothetical protein